LEYIENIPSGNPADVVAKEFALPFHTIWQKVIEPVVGVEVLVTVGVVVAVELDVLELVEALLITTTYLITEAVRPPESVTL